MNLREWMDYLRQKNEHYRISDEFVKKYQQSPANKNGYVYYAWEEGKIIHSEVAEPNQKWHFFDSYIHNILADDKIMLTDNAEKIYNGLKCPELILWIAEASEVDEKIIEKASKEAKRIIEEGKRFARNSAGYAIRKRITWKLIETGMKDSLNR